mmetsp:Transcript_25687/g.38781  ORF Transcript_25687/g.38781 Transcript_25687/m.38781 type:complete len:490 (-) Transcript_25687:63-1532(-)|eukprot:CAMPEP_0194223236 /NCGR_PEP_ID=MMETSP0156-20130528/34643_1 /TAXON_ID=33649 /ORGANISM="Thalassionema nitzschioides, Strain L26-B" /LENGTH=489 /DNA_ID=CAMNT_0038954303 /DNA_START=37 /DNA_END=1506 /DNA_ORIENTATION=-
MMQAFHTLLILLACNIVEAWIQPQYLKTTCTILTASKGAKKWKRKKEWLKSRGWWDGEDDPDESSEGVITLQEPPSRRATGGKDERIRSINVENNQFRPNNSLTGKVNADRGSNTLKLSEQEIILLQRIQGCDTLEELLFLFDHSKDEMLPFHVSYYWNQLSQVMVYDKIGRKRINNDRNLLLPLVEHTAKVSDEFDARTLSSTAHGIAKVSSKSNVTIKKDMWMMLKDKAIKIKSFDSRETSLLLWSFAKMNIKASDLFDMIASETILKLDGFSPQSIANILWSYAKLDYRAPDLFNTAARVSVAKIDEFNSQDLSNTLWAFAKARHAAPELFDEAILAARLRIDAFKAREIASISSSYAKMGHHAPELFKAIELAAVKRLNTFKSQELSNTLWACGKLDHAAPRLFVEAEEVLIKNMDTFMPQGIANTLWAYGKLGLGSAELFEAVACTVTNNPGVFKSREVKRKIEFAFRQSGHSTPKVLSGDETH